MPRPNRSFGRPGTQVIPKGWSADHAPVVAGSWNATCLISPPAGGTVAVAADLSVTVTGAPVPVGPFGCRVQQLNSQEAVQVVADQKITGAPYLVVVDATTVVALNSTVTIDNANDVDLVGRVMTVVKIGRGSELWERDLFCVEDQSAPDPT